MQRNHSIVRSGFVFIWRYILWSNCTLCLNTLRYGEPYHIFKYHGYAILPVSLIPAASLQLCFLGLKLYCHRTSSCNDIVTLDNSVQRRIKVKQHNFTPSLMNEFSAISRSRNRVTW